MVINFTLLKVAFELPVLVIDPPILNAVFEFPVLVEDVFFR